MKLQFPTNVKNQKNQNALKGEESNLSDNS